MFSTLVFSAVYGIERRPTTFDSRKARPAVLQIQETRDEIVENPDTHRIGDATTRHSRDEDRDEERKGNKRGRSEAHISVGPRAYPAQPGSPTVTINNTSPVP